MKQNRNAVGFSTLALAGILATSGPNSTAADADDESRYLPWDRVSLSVGGLVSTFDSTLTFGSASTGAEFNGEDRLGLDSTLVVFRVEALYRPDPEKRHQIDFAYGGYHRDGDAVLSRDVTIDGVTYPVGAAVDSTFDFDIFRATYSYALFQNQRARVALGLGMYGIPVEYGLNITTGGGRSVVEGADTAFPMPSVALRTDFQLLPKLFLTAAVDGMYLEINDFDGALLEANVGLEYRIWEHFGVGVGYNGMLVKVEANNIDSDYPGVDWVGSVKVNYHGLMLFGKLAF